MIPAVVSNVANAVTATGAAGTTPVGGAGSSGGTSFGEFLAHAIDQVNSLSQSADQMAVTYAAGGPVSTAQLMIAESQATLAVDMMSQVATRVQQAYSTMMNMQI
ncbi:flagellar hook-basal body complex protein FliE [Alicyclobacillus sacchari]|uniref:Flagellar hook-basal body complex protein FliE n=1 Tax=Alicyclobacillus sacchari TaxID=392010 RepID=A0A4R8LSF1_9BACL|nr:flagellar hook-basal body complex protein FliE [Alicyclobacillus sacchari]TDY50474.1 flagellar hook-basal body complex protein FliE [Alicyclobacillus sacchari]